MMRPIQVPGTLPNSSDLLDWSFRASQSSRNQPVFSLNGRPVACFVPDLECGARHLFWNIRGYIQPICEFGRIWFPWKPSPLATNLSVRFKQYVIHQFVYHSEKTLFHIKIYLEGPFPLLEFASQPHSPRPADAARGLCPTKHSLSRPTLCLFEATLKFWLRVAHWFVIYAVSGCYCMSSEILGVFCSVGSNFWVQFLSPFPRIFHATHLMKVLSPYILI
jgi:hypothetical protein